MSIIHLGIRIQEKPSNYINKDFYLSSKPEGIAGWDEHAYAKQIKLADLNFDMNMQYFESLNTSTFEKHIQKQSKHFKLSDCSDLKELDGISGVYVMVLDKYKQVYIGKADDIKKRIQQHWNKRKSLERLLFGDVCTSIISIDSFGALDTTRVFYRRTNTAFHLENDMIQAFDAGYLLNRDLSGIRASDSLMRCTTAIHLAINSNRSERNLIPYLDIQRLQLIVSEERFKQYLQKYPELQKRVATLSK